MLLQRWGNLVFDAAEVYAMPLSCASLDRSVGVHYPNGAKFSHVARAIRLLPGKSLCKWLRRQEQRS